MKDYKRLTKNSGWYKDIDLTQELGYSYIYQRLSELENKIENGTLIELPCKVGDTVYCVFSPKYPANPNDKGKWFMGEYQVEKFYYGIKGLSIGIYAFAIVNEKQLGKTVFLTKAEAEKKLAELKG